VLDLYAASVLAATRHPSVPAAHWDGVRVFLPASQRHRVIEAEAFDRPARVRQRGSIRTSFARRQNAS
jgi:hypothetical protein